MTPPLDLSRPVQTRDGDTARIICTDYKGSQPVIAAVMQKDGTEYIRFYDSNGHYSDLRSNRLDLINTPIKRSGWVNIYPHSLNHQVFSLVYDTKEEADRRAMTDRIACIRVEFVEGEGLV